MLNETKIFLSQISNVNALNALLQYREQKLYLECHEKFEVNEKLKIGIENMLMKFRKTHLQMDWGNNLLMVTIYTIGKEKVLNYVR